MSNNKGGGGGSRRGGCIRGEFDMKWGGGHGVGGGREEFLLNVTKGEIERERNGTMRCKEIENEINGKKGQTAV